VLGTGQLTGAPELGGAGIAGELPGVDQPSFEEVRAHALELAAKDPATAAVVLRQWLGSASNVAAAS
jgi:hypothetical protein